jgi:AcrR family transcriptional regulator
MSARADAVRETRERIVAAATKLHATQGVLATNWEEVAAEAGVSPATVYRHFPSLVELIPACARSVFDVARPPTLEEANEKFATMSTVRERFAQLIADSCHCYEKGDAWLHAARRERELIPAIDEVVSLQETALAVLVKACLAEHRVSRRTFELLCVLCDFPFWKSLVAAGTPRPAAARTITTLVNDALDREDIR